MQLSVYCIMLYSNVILASVVTSARRCRPAMGDADRFLRSNRVIRITGRVRKGSCIFRHSALTCICVSGMKQKRMPRQENVRQ